MTKEEKLQSNKSEAGVEQNIDKISKISRESMEEFRKLFRLSLEKLKEYGVNQRLLDPETPLEQVRAELIDKIKELNERKMQHRTEIVKTGKKEKRILKDHRRS